MIEPSGQLVPNVPTIGALLERRALRNREATALVADGLRLSFGELQAWAVAVDAALAAAGVGVGDRVAVLSRNCAASIALYYGVARRGAILCNVNIRLGGDELAHIVEDCAPALFISQPEFEDIAGELARRFGVLRRWTVDKDPFPEPPALGAVGLDTGSVHAVGSMNAQERFASDRPLLLVYTSGTTGRPRGALLSHAGLYWAAATIAGSLDYRHGDVSLIPVPLFHVGGMSSATLFAYLGASAVVPTAWEPGAILSVIETERVNHFFAVATMLRGLLDHPDFASTDLSNLRFVMVGGAPVPPGLIEAFAGHGIPVLHTYGSTETAGPATVVDAEHHLSKAGSAGLPFFHTDLRVVGSRGNVLGANEIGEIQVRAPHLILGYWGDRQATDEAFTSGWFRTGDVGCLDPEGYLYVKDRKKDVIISGGENIFPGEVEAVLAQHPSIAEVAVVACPDPTWGEVPCAILVLREDAQPVDQRAVEAFCADRLARFKIPKSIVISDRPLPRNATGKLLRHLMRKAIEEK